MKRHTISKLQGTIVVLTVLIAVTLGMTNPSTVLGARAPTEYIDVALVECSDTSDTAYEVYVTVYFYEVTKSGSPALRGWAYPACTVSNGYGPDADTMNPFPTKLGMWEVGLSFHDLATGEFLCTILIYDNPITGTNFPATITRTCGSQTATITIGTPRVFP